METKNDAAHLLNPLALNEMVRQAHGTAKEKGWHDPGMEKTVGDDVALMHSELSELLEDFRAGHKPDEIYYEATIVCKETGSHKKVTLKSGELLGNTFVGMPKPCGIPIELADVLIRAADFCGKYGIDLDTAVKLKLEYNKSRSHRHGGKAL